MTYAASRVILGARPGLAVPEPVVHAEAWEAGAMLHAALAIVFKLVESVRPVGGPSTAPSSSRSSPPSPLRTRPAGRAPRGGRGLNEQ
ncbi:hypothetical protein F7Q99_29620 [Streptomyces kaniharaensis]|uniref:Uncharacterized protein n=1 Tax=Streptomyces kaniharaensis TaxID=212423 RepID=A0A6N7L244_9ACTN|nr:hypothetical protein [Streptomyces kaniharaensis]MQS16264.1 hypothetical protein [Streptomyces kaniharaensis]